MLAEVQYNAAILIAVTILVLIATFIAWVMGYYRLPEEKRVRRFAGWAVILAFVLYFFVQLIIIPIGIYLESGSVPEERGWINLISIFFSTAAVFFLSVSLGSQIRAAIWNFGSAGWLKNLKSAVIGAATWLLAYPWVVIIGQFATICLILWYGEKPPEADQDMVYYLKEITDNRPLFITTIAAVIVLVPLAEELLFRGFLQSWLKTYLPISFSIALSSILFACLHFSTEQALLNWSLIPSLFALSCYLGFVYERQQTLIAPVFLHMTVNAISTAVIFI